MDQTRERERECLAPEAHSDAYPYWVWLGKVRCKLQQPDNSIVETHTLLHFCWRDATISQRKDAWELTKEPTKGADEGADRVDSGADQSSFPFASLANVVCLPLHSLGHGSGTGADHSSASSAFLADLCDQCTLHVAADLFMGKKCQILNSAQRRALL